MPSRRSRPTHPGEVLESEYLSEFQLDPVEFATAIGVDASRVASLLSGEAGLDADMALRLARYFGTTPDGWLNLQREVDLWDAERVGAAAIARISPVDVARRRPDDYEPLPPEFIASLAAQVADCEGRVRWMIVSDPGPRPQTVKCDEHWGYYDVEDDMWAMDLVFGTQFKRREDARVIAERMRDGVPVIELDPAVVDQSLRLAAGDRALYRRLLEARRRRRRTWQPADQLRSEEDVIAYLEIAAQTGEHAIVAAAVDDAMAALRRMRRESDED